MSSALNDVCTAILEDQNQATKGHDGAACLNLVGRCGHASLPSPAQPRDQSLARIQFTSHGPHTDITDSNSQPSLPPEHPDEREVLDLNDSSSMSPDNDLPAAEPSMLPQAASLLSPNFPYPREFDTHPRSTRSALPIVLNRYWIIGFCVCILAFLAYSRNSHN